MQFFPSGWDCPNRFIEFEISCRIRYRDSMATAYLFVAHGSREEEGNRAFLDLIEDLRKRHPRQLIEMAYLDVLPPSIPEGIETCLKKGAREVVILPLMIFPGRHVSRDIPRMIEEASQRRPGVIFRYAGALFEDRGLVDLLDKKIRSIERKARCPFPS